MKSLVLGCFVAVAIGAASVVIALPAKAAEPAGSYRTPEVDAVVVTSAEARAQREADAAAARRSVPDGRTVYAMAYPYGPGAPLSAYAAPDQRYPSVGGDMLRGAPYADTGS